MRALADDAALARLLIAAAAVIDFSIEGGKAMGERDDEADPQTKIRLTYTTRAALRQLRQVGKAGAPYVRFAGVPDIDYFCDDCNAEMLSAEYKKP